MWSRGRSRRRHQAPGRASGAAQVPVEPPRPTASRPAPSRAKTRATVQGERPPPPAGDGGSAAPRSTVDRAGADRANAVSGSSSPMPYSLGVSSRAARTGARLGARPAGGSRRPDKARPHRSMQRDPGRALALLSLNGAARARSQAASGSSSCARAAEPRARPPSRPEWWPAAPRASPQLGVAKGANVDHASPPRGRRGARLEGRLQGKAGLSTPTALAATEPARESMTRPRPEASALPRPALAGPAALHPRSAAVMSSRLGVAKSGDTRPRRAAAACRRPRAWQGGTGVARAAHPG